MVDVVSNATAVLVALSVTVYLSVMAVLFWRLVFEEPVLRRALTVPLLPVFFQNCGIPFAIVAFAFRSTELAVVSLLLIALSLAAADEDTAALNPSVELPLLVSAIASFGAIGVLNLVG
ncbi:MAG: hypothetical protein MI920_19870 [Kiloniellales bacterium]|nr:hypothetical protein [Kiloniellales bacterium]